MQVSSEALHAFPMKAVYKNLPKLVQFIARHLPKKAKVLDVGSGEGDLWTHIPKVKALRTDKVKFTGYYGRRIHSAGQALAVRSGFFRHVVSTFALEYADKAAVLSEINRVMKVNGRLILLLHHPKSVVVKAVQEESRVFRQAQELLRNAQNETATHMQLKGVEAEIKKSNGNWNFISELDLIEARKSKFYLEDMKLDPWQLLRYALLCSRIHLLEKETGLKRRSVRKKDFERAHRLFELAQERMSALNGPRSGVFQNEDKIRQQLSAHGFKVEKVRVIDHGKPGTNIKTFAVTARKCREVNV